MGHRRPSLASTTNEITTLSRGLSEHTHTSPPSFEASPTPTCFDAHAAPNPYTPQPLIIIQTDIVTMEVQQQTKNRAPQATKGPGELEGQGGATGKG